MDGLIMGEVRHPRILVIEDDVCYQRLLERYIHRCGGHLGCASDGKTGLEKALSHHYDIVFVDIQLPKLDGFMVATLLREAGCEIPLIAMTAFQLEGMKSKAHAMGFNEFLVKPIFESTIAKLLESYVPMLPK